MKRRPSVVFFRTSHSAARRLCGTSRSVAYGLAILFAAVAVSGAHPEAQAGTDLWTTHGPQGGQVDALAIDPDIPSTLYAATGGGVFKSTDSGGSWSLANAGLTAFAASALAIDPVTPSTLYVGTSRGVFKSTDGAGTWVPAHTGLPISTISALAIDRGAPSTLYAGTTFGGGGVFKSTDGGGSWQPANTGLPAFQEIRALAIDPATPTTLYAGVNGVYKSTNGGGTWSPASTGLPETIVDALAIDPDTPSTLYAGTSKGVFKSTNSAGSWNPASIGLAIVPLSKIALIPQVLALAIDPDTPSTLYAGTAFGGVFKSTDSGGSWGPVNSGLPLRTVSELAINRSAPSTLYAGAAFRDGGGVYKSGDSGGSWSPANTGLIATSVIALVIDSNTPSTLYAGTSRDGLGLYKSIDSGGTWVPANTGLRRADLVFGGLASASVNALAIDPTTPSTLYAGTNGVYKSTNGGSSWSPANTGLPVSLVNFPVVELAVARSTPSTLYAITLDVSLSSAVYKSTDSAGSWSPASNGLPTATTYHALAIDPTTPSTLYAGTHRGVYKSTNGGGSWEPANTGLAIQQHPTLVVIALVIDPSTPSTLYAGTAAGGVFKSTNGGGSWGPSSTGLNDLDTGVVTVTASIRALAIDPITPSTLYAGTLLSGIFKSTDGGASWSAANWIAPSAGWVLRSVKVLAIDPITPSIVYAGAEFGGGVFDIEQSTTSMATPTPTGTPTVSDMAVRKCRAAIVTAGAALVQAEAKAERACAGKVVSGKLPQGTTCRTEPKTAAAIAKARTKLAGVVAKSCGGKDKTCGAGNDDVSLVDAGWVIGSCPNVEGGACTNTISDCSGIAICLTCIGETALAQAIDLYYGDLTPTDPHTDTEKALNKCQATIGKSAVTFLIAKSKALQKCWTSVSMGKASGACPAADRKAEPAIAKAEAKKIHSICKACGGGGDKQPVDGHCDTLSTVMPTAIGFAAICPAVQVPGGQDCGAIGAIDTLDELIACVDCVTEFDVDCADRNAVPGFVAYPDECAS